MIQQQFIYLQVDMGLEQARGIPADKFIDFIKEVMKVINDHPEGDILVRITNTGWEMAALTDDARKDRQAKGIGS